MVPDSAPRAKHQAGDLWAGKWASYLKYIASDIPWGVKEGLLAREQGGILPSEIGPVILTPWRKANPPASRYHVAVENLDTKPLALAFYVDTTACSESYVALRGNSFKNVL